jgi:hypothetical protein
MRSSLEGEQRENPVFEVLGLHGWPTGNEYQDSEVSEICEPQSITLRAAVKSSENSWILKRNSLIFERVRSSEIGQYRGQF